MSQWPHSQLHYQHPLRTTGCQQAKTHDFPRLVLAVQGKMLHSNKWDLLKNYSTSFLLIKFNLRVHLDLPVEGDHHHLQREEDLRQQFQIDQVNLINLLKILTKIL